MSGGTDGFAQLSELLVSDKALGGVARDVVDLVRSALEQCDGVGMQLLDRDGLGARTATDTRSSQLDALQEELDDGPSIECLRTGEVHDLEPVTSEERWPAFAPFARRDGLSACLAVPLVAHGQLIGALNLYAWRAGGFAGWDRERCSAFARRAAMSLASAQAYTRTQFVITELEVRLAGADDLVHRAHGVLMERESIGLEDAVARLSEMAEARSCALATAARSVLESVPDAN
jgi:GAF domain-containing protein